MRAVTDAAADGRDGDGDSAVAGNPVGPAILVNPIVVETYSGQIPQITDLTPDADLAVSPDHIVVVNNFTVQVRLRDTALTLVNRWSIGPPASSPTTRFWDQFPALANRLIVDPEVHWDEDNQRFFLIAIVGHQIPPPGEPPGNPNLVLAVSKGANPAAASGVASDAWWQYGLSVTLPPGDFADSPTLAVRRGVTAIGYDYVSGTPYGSHALFLRTNDLLFGPHGPGKTWVNQVEFQFQSRTLALTPHRKSSALDDTIYALQTCDNPAICGPGNSLTVHAFVNPLGYPGDQSADAPFEHLTHKVLLTGGNTYYKPNGPPKGDGTVATYQLYGPRIWHSTWINHSFWAAHEVSESPTGKTRTWWYQVALNGFPFNPAAPPTIAQFGQMIPANGDESWFSPAIAADTNDNACVLWSSTAAQVPIELRRAFRMATDGSGTLRQPPGTVASSPTPLAIAKIDDSGVVADPVMPGVFWYTGVTRSAGGPNWQWDQWLGCVVVQ